jgi:hypothetical protein
MTPHPTADCKALADSLPIPAPWSIERFGEAIGRQRGRRLILTRTQLPSGHPGLWFALPLADLIIYPRADDPAAELRAIGHQLAHMLLDHKGAPASESPFPHVDSTTAATVAIIRYTQPEEKTADEFAAHLAARVTR